MKRFIKKTERKKIKILNNLILKYKNEQKYRYIITSATDLNLFLEMMAAKHPVQIIIFLS
jgi:hypothetical protein